MTVAKPLADVLSEFARTMLTDFPIQGILDHLVVRIVEVLPVTAAGVTLMTHDSGPRYVAASDAAALRFERLQSELCEGPCVDAFNSGRAVAVPDLAGDHGYERFAPPAAAAGLAAVFAFPLRHGDHVSLGALDLYRDTPGGLDAEAMAAAQTLADVAAAYILNAQAREELSDAADHFRQSSLHDPLTGLPNRVLFRERLEHAVQRTMRAETVLAVLFADLDGFKTVNDLYGHEVGDQLLVAVGRRLSLLLRPQDTLARLAGDEFVILCEDLDRDEDVTRVAVRISAALAEPFSVAGHDLYISGSVGVAISAEAPEAPDRLLAHADAAMYQAKLRGGGHHQVFDPRHETPTAREITLGEDLEGASDRGELRLLYQPIVATADGFPVGFEAFVRWVHPSRGVLAPATFLPAAERARLLDEVGRWVLGLACTDLARGTARPDRYPDPGPGVSVNVNVSTLELLSPGYAAGVTAIINDSGVDADRVVLEIAESAFREDPDRSLIVLQALKRTGVQVALGGFGAGCSSLRYLQDFPIDVMKIDQRLVAQVDRDPANGLVMGALIGLAHDLGLTVVAEGVEREDQLREIVARGCDLAQGFYFGVPAPRRDPVA